jgi:hypothetical protein
MRTLLNSGVQRKLEAVWNPVNLSRDWSSDQPGEKGVPGEQLQPRIPRRPPMITDNGLGQAATAGR